MNRMSRVAEEAQLLAEEKWILEALTKIKHQRNCLQIERLHLESLRAGFQKEESSNDETQKQKDTKGKGGGKGSQKHSKGKGNVKQEEAKGSDNKKEQTSGITMKSSASTSNVDITQTSACKRKVEDDVDTMCNNYEELDLAVTKSAFAQNIPNDLEESDEDDETDNVGVDMDMFMHQKLGSSPPPA